ncbi:MAG: hypothetical protein R6X23_02605 [Acidimicrobiia bacterium]
MLARPPRPPRDPVLFSSNSLFGEPGIYPGGPEMVPAAGPPVDDAGARRALVQVVCPDAERFDDAELVARVPEPLVRAGLVALAGTVAAPLLDAFIAGHASVETLGIGPPASPGRVVGPPADDPSIRVVNERYRAEHPALLAISLTHDLLWRAREPDQVEEATLHALGAMVHLQLVARAPALAHLGTELARRQNSLALTLLDSRRPGRGEISLIAADGPGTIPGGAPDMQTPDFWSIPFVVGDPPPAPPEAPTLLGRCLERVVVPGAALPDPLRYDAGLGAWIGTHLGRDWLPGAAQLRAAVALGAVDEGDLASASGLEVDVAVCAFGVEDAVACFRRRR